MSNFLNKILNVGVEFAEGDSLLQKKYILTNTICLLLGISTIPFIIVFYLIGGEGFGALTLINDLLFFFGIYLNSKGKINLSRNLTLLVWSSGVLIFTMFLGKETALQNCYFSVIAVPFIMFKPTENKTKFLHLIFPFLAYFFIEFDPFQVSGKALLSEEAGRSIRNFVNPTVLFQVVTVVYYYSFQEKYLIKEIALNTKLNNSLKHQSKELLGFSKDLKRSEAGLNSLLNSIDDVVVEVDSNACIVNSWTSEDYDLEKGAPIKDYFGRFMQIKVEGAFSQFKGDYFNKVHEYSFNNLHYQFKITPVRQDDNEHETAVIAIRDITLNKQLAEEYNDIKREKELAQKSAEFKESFLANMSHEIRTPLNGVVGMIDLLNDTELNVIQKDYINTLKSSSDNLLGLINDILDLSKIQAGKMQLTIDSNDIRLLMKNVLELFSPMARSKGLKLDVDVDNKLVDFYKFDKTRLNQVLTNLVSNAVKFTIDGGVTLRVKLIEDEVRFEVLDTGEGISREGQRKLFQKFSQLEKGDNNSPIKGTGLGLSIVSELVELMGGAIKVESEEGKGSSFYFSLKLEEGVAPKKEVVIESKSQLSGIQVLLVDDVAVNRKVASLMLKKMNCIVTEAQNGLEALEYVDSQNFDLVLMDIQMPKMNGIDAMNHMKDNGKSFPIVALSANALEGDREKYLNIGFEGYISKPLTFSKLQSGLEETVILTNN